MAFASLNWHDDAACRPYPLAWWFPSTRHDRNPRPEHLRALDICWNECPVRGECAAWAFTRPASDGLVGIWGGYTTRQRLQLTKAVTR